jgi:hypothetical protein
MFFMLVHVIHQHETFWTKSTSGPEHCAGGMRLFLRNAMPAPQGPTQSDRAERSSRIKSRQFSVNAEDSIGSEFTTQGSVLA